MKFAHRTVGFEFHKPVMRALSYVRVQNVIVSTWASARNAFQVGKSVCQWQYLLGISIFTHMLAMSSYLTGWYRVLYVGIRSVHGNTPTDSIELENKTNRLVGRWLIGGRQFMII